MTLTKAIPILNAAPVPLDGRLADMATVVANADGSPRTGVLAGGASIVSTTATLNLAVAAAEFVTSKGKADGASIFTNDGTVNVAVGAAPASNSRIDVLWVKQNDNTTGDANSLPTFGVTAGTAAASPSKPAIPTGALELATLRIYSGTTATNGGSNVLTNTYQMTAMRGGVVTFRTKVDLDLWTTAADGQLAFCLDVDAVFVYLAQSAIGWVHADGKPVIETAPTFTPGIPAWATGSPAPRIFSQGGRIYLEGAFLSTVSASFAAGSIYAIGSVPAALAPVAERNIPIASNAGVAAALVVTAAGAMSVRFFTAYTGTLAFYLDGVSWPDERLG